MPEVLKTVIFPDVFIQSLVSSDPEVTVRIFKKDRIIKTMVPIVTITGNGSRFQAVRLVCMEHLMQGIETVKPFPLVVDPDLVKLVFVNIRDPVFRGCVLAFPRMIHLELIPVIPVEPVLGAEPHKAQIIFKKRGDKAMGEPILQVDTVKTNVVVLGAY
jgi:hypothetical protein